MSDRMTKANLEARTESLNRRMERHGSIYRYQLYFANGRTGLLRGYEDGTVVSDARYGTKNEIGEFIYAMQMALDDAEYTERVQ